MDFDFDDSGDDSDLGGEMDDFLGGGDSDDMSFDDGDDFSSQSPLASIYDSISAGNMQEALLEPYLVQ